MKEKREMVAITLLICTALLCIAGCSQTTAKKASSPLHGSQLAQPSAPLQKTASFPSFELPKPTSGQEKTYLGISGFGNFTISQIKAKALVIEVFSMYCPHCHMEAPHVNDFYQALEAMPDLKDKIKIIGIGIGNSVFEVQMFKDKYNILFPLFPDPGKSVCKLLGVMNTPTFIVVRIHDDGTLENFYFKPGKLGNIDEFVAKIIDHL